MAELVFQRLVLARLNALFPRVWVFRANTGMARGASGQLVKFGEPGQADILGVAAGRALAVEMKDDGGRQTPAQIAWQAKWESAGGVYLLAVGREGSLEAIRTVEMLIGARPTSLEPEE